MESIDERLCGLLGEAAAYVGGTWTGGSGERRSDVYDPATGERIASVPALDSEDVTAAVGAADEAFSAWRRTTAKKRSVLLRRWHDLIGEHSEVLALILTREQGKPLQEARNELAQSQAYIEFFAEETRRLYGETIPANTADRRLLVTREAVGVVGVIAPWNFPAAMIARKAGAALAAGCTVVAKPAAETPLSALALAMLAEAAGFPPGVFNVVTGRGSEIGAALTGDPRVRKISFTGSTPTGKQLARESADTLKHLSLELGGSAPLIVFADADLELAVRGALASKFRNAGQTCVATNRIFVHEHVAEEFTARLAAAAGALRVGPGTAEGTQIGPLINVGAAEAVGRLLATASAEGARVVTDGEPTEPLGGSYVRPVVLAGVTDDMEIVRTEIFGPIAPVSTFTDTDEVVARANATVYGLAAYFYTNDYRRIVRVSEALAFGMVGANETLTTTEVAPFGGVKDSGYGREGSHYGLEEYTQLKYICVGGLA